MPDFLNNLQQSPKEVLVMVSDLQVVLLTRMSEVENMLSATCTVGGMCAHGK